MADVLVRGRWTCRSQRGTFPVKAGERFLDQLGFPRFEVGLAALGANPGWHGIPGHVIAFSIQTKGGCPSDHQALAMDTFHHSRIDGLCPVYRHCLRYAG